MTPDPTPTRRAALSLLAGGAVVAACGEGAVPQEAVARRPERPVRSPVLRPAPRLALRPSGLDAALLERADARANELTQLRAMIVARNGEVLLERAYRGPDLGTPVNIKSASKTVLALTAGAAMEAGVVPGLDTPAVGLIGGAPEGADPRVGDITIAHLLSMRAGLQSTSGRNYGPWAVSRNPVRHALTRPMVDAPGGAVIYSTGTSHLTSAVLTAASGTSTLALVRRFIGEPLGIRVPAWERDPTGLYYGGNNMMLSPRDLLRIGEMCRLGGTIDGTRVLTPEWLEASWQPRGVSRWSGAGYGYGWWLADTVVGGRALTVRYAWGYGGQMLYVVPELGLSVVITSASDPSQTERGHVGRLHRMVGSLILPAVLADAPTAPVPA